MLSRTIAPTSRSFATLAVAVAAAALASACGGANATDLFDGVASATLDASVGTPSGDDGSVTPTNDANDSPDAATPVRDAAVQVDSGGATRDAGGKVDAGRDAGPTHPVAKIACGSDTCSVPAQDCCRTSGFTGAPTYTCVTKGACFGFQSLTIPCDDAADCAALGSPGQLCCYTAASNTGAVSDVSCRAASACIKPRGNLCDPYANIATSCPNTAGSATCAASADKTFDYSVCAP